MRFSLSLLVLPFLLLACSAAQRSHTAEPKEGSATRTSETPQPLESRANSPESSPEVVGVVSLTPPAAGELLEIEEKEVLCPEDMLLVEGLYCTAESNAGQEDQYGNTPGAGADDIKVIDRACKKHWYAPQNKKTVCEEFEEEATCTGKLIKKRFCVDRYAWPNQRGARPEVMNRFYQAQIKCAAINKRLCTESEWTFSCEGPSMKPFPYGFVRDANKCHGDEKWDRPDMMKVAKREAKELKRLYKAERSHQSACVSDFDVFDLPGNNDEIVASETFERGWRSRHESVTTGGPWYKGVRNQCRPKIYSHDEGFYHYYMGFRCCADAGADEIDPLTPTQKKEGWTMSRVESIAGVKVQEMRELLLKKAADPTCGCRTKRCRTLCGTLHGNDWAEAPPNSLMQKNQPPAPAEPEVQPAQ